MILKNHRDTLESQTNKMDSVLRVVERVVDYLDEMKDTTKGIVELNALMAKRSSSHDSGIEFLVSKVASLEKRIHELEQEANKDV